MPALPGPFVIDVPQDRLDDLARRLRDTRWALDLDNEHGYYGMSTNELKALVDYWIDGFDWRAIERRLNQFTHYRVTVDAVPVHFIHRPGTGPAPIPIILSHGWPWTFWDYSKVIILTNATIYWVNAAIGQSIRSYRNAVRYPWTPSHDRTPAIEAPAGFTFLAGDQYPPGSDVATRVAIFENGPTRHWYNPVYAKAHQTGGHFVPWENPDALVEDVRETFRKLR